MSVSDRESSGVSPVIHHALVLLPVLCLLPFLNKAFHIDDTVYLWVAQHIQAHPLDFYGFEKNWSFFDEPMYEINKNPPGVSYYIALMALVFGWSEVGLHIAFLFPAVALSYGTYALAKQLCQSTHIATLAVMLSPVVMVSSTNVMSDTLMLAFFVWAAALWVQGLPERDGQLLTTAMFLALFAVLTKYPALYLLPLLFAYSCAQQRRVGRWALYFLIPMTGIVLYQFVSYSLYGINLIESAIEFARNHESDASTMPTGSRVMVALSFVGGCHAAIFFFAPLCWSRRTLAIIASGSAIAIALPFIFGSNFSDLLFHPSFDVFTTSILQAMLFACGGLAILVLATMDLYRYRNANSLLLFLWVMGVFTFTAFVNWTINGRTVMPMAPAVGILIARRLDLRIFTLTPLRCAIPIAMMASLALLVTWSDYALAHAGKRAGSNVMRRASQESETVWIQGNWGPRWYFEKEGALPFDSREPKIALGDVIIQSSNNLIYPLDGGLVRRADTLDFGVFPSLTTMDRSTGAGFYSNAWGPLPYAFGPIPQEFYHVLVVDPHDPEESPTP